MYKQFISAAFLGLVALIPFTSADIVCFNGGGQVGDCSNAIPIMCDLIDGAVFSSGGAYSTCVDKRGFHCDMAIQNTGGGGLSIGRQECINDMNAINNGCSGQGGHLLERTFQLTADPNAGPCRTS